MNEAGAALLVLVESHGMREGVHERFQLRETMPSRATACSSSWIACPKSSFGREVKETLSINCLAYK